MGSVAKDRARNKKESTGLRRRRRGWKQ